MHIQKLLLLEAKVEKERADGIASIRKAEIETYKILYGDKEELDKKAKAQEEKRLEDEKKHLDDLKKEQDAYNKNIETLTDEFFLSDREKLERSFEKKWESITGSTFYFSFFRLI